MLPASASSSIPTAVWRFHFVLEIIILIYMMMILAMIIFPQIAGNDECLISAISELPPYLVRFPTTGSWGTWLHLTILPCCLNTILLCSKGPGKPRLPRYAGWVILASSSSGIVERISVWEVTICNMDEVGHFPFAELYFTFTFFQSTNKAQFEFERTSTQGTAIVLTSSVHCFLPPLYLGNDGPKYWK